MGRRPGYSLHCQLGPALQHSACGTFRQIPHAGGHRIAGAEGGALGWSVSKALGPSWPLMLILTLAPPRPSSLNQTSLLLILQGGRPVMISSIPSRVWRKRWTLCPRLSWLSLGPKGPRLPMEITLQFRWGYPLAEGARYVQRLGSLAAHSPFLQHPGRLKISSKQTSHTIDPLIKHPAMKRLAGYVKGKLQRS